jgi:hypothetical protein
MAEEKDQELKKLVVEHKQLEKQTHELVAEVIECKNNPLNKSVTNETSKQEL